MLACDYVWSWALIHFLSLRANIRAARRASWMHWENILRRENVALFQMQLLRLFCVQPRGVCAHSSCALSITGGENGRGNLGAVSLI